jgi:hypothetical protein
MDSPFEHLEDIIDDLECPFDENIELSEEEINILNLRK